MDKPKPRRKYLHCSRCGVKKLFRIQDIDLSERFLCDTCDEEYFFWQLSVGRPHAARGNDLDTFLKMRPHSA